jgi:hypothetical protein
MYPHEEATSFGDRQMSDDLSPDHGAGADRFSPELDLSNENSRASTAQTKGTNFIPHSPMRRAGPPMSYTEQLEHNQRVQAESIKPQVNNLSPLILQGQPRSHEDLVRQSPSHRNGGRAQTAASVNPVSGVSMLSNTFSNVSSSESVFSQGSNGSGASRGGKSRGGPKIITGVPGQDPMSVSAYRRFVGTSAAGKNKNF